MATQPLQFPKRSGNKFSMPPAGVEQMLARAPDGNSDVTSALRFVGDAYIRTMTAHGAYMNDGTLTQQAQLVRSARYARQTMTPAIERLRNTRATARGARESLEQKVAKLFDYAGNFADTMVAAEIRSHFASLPISDRWTAVMAAVDGKDQTTLRALGAGPSYLSGLQADRHAYVKNMMIDMNPEVAAARDAAKALAEQEQFAELLETTLMQSIADGIDFRQAASLEATATMAAA